MIASLSPLAALLTPLPLALLLTRSLPLIGLIARTLKASRDRRLLMSRTDECSPDFERQLSAYAEKDAKRNGATCEAHLEAMPPRGIGHPSSQPRRRRGRE